MKFFSLFFSLFFLANFTYAQCIAGETYVDATNGAVTVNYTITNADCESIQSISFDSFFGVLGTITSSSCSGFTVVFDQISGSSIIDVVMEDDDGNPIFCDTGFITVDCNAQLVVNMTNLTCGDDDNSVDLNISNDNNSPIGDFEVTSTNGLSFNSIGIVNGDLVANLSLSSDCSSGGSYCITATSDCGGTKQVCRTVNREQPSVGAMQGADALCLTGNGVSEIYSLSSIENLYSDCVTVDWSIYPTTGSSLWHGGGQGAIAHFSEEGTYTVTATITACGQTIIRQSDFIEVCRELDYDNSTPYTGIAICSEGNPNCFTLPDWCFTEMEITTNDHKLWIDYDGERTICVSEISHLNRARTSSIYITPSNNCGTGPTIEVLVDVDDPYLCDNGNFFGRIADESPDRMILAKVNNRNIRFDLGPVEGEVAGTQNKLEIFDLQGRLLSQKNLAGGALNLADASLPTAVLIARLTLNGKIYVEKFIH